MPQEHIRVVPVRTRVHDDDLSTTRLRGIGFQATNGDTWRGPIRPVRQDAVQDAYDRKANPQSEWSTTSSNSQSEWSTTSSNYVDPDDAAAGTREPRRPVAPTDSGTAKIELPAPVE